MNENPSFISNHGEKMPVAGNFTQHPSLTDKPDDTESDIVSKLGQFSLLRHQFPLGAREVNV